MTPSELKKFRAIPKREQVRLMMAIYNLLRNTEKPEKIPTKTLFCGKCEVIDLRKVFRDNYERMMGAKTDI